jgi:hypothetical protein
MSIYGGSKKETEVDCFVLNDLLKQNNMSKIDFCSIDVEGAELDILKTIDFDNFHFDVFSIENNYSTSHIKKFLESKGYEGVVLLGCDEIYRKK